uniref:Uncharacterized protein n=1 Tax=Arundo donax TaxID=35708 RepID=A0A0A8ZSX7_ARUDO
MLTTRYTERGLKGYAPGTSDLRHRALNLLLIYHL